MYCQSLHRVARRARGVLAESAQRPHSETMGSLSDNTVAFATVSLPTDGISNGFKGMLRAAVNNWRIRMQWKVAIVLNDCTETLSELSDVLGFYARPTYGMIVDGDELSEGIDPLFEPWFSVGAHVSGCVLKILTVAALLQRGHHALVLDMKVFCVASPLEPLLRRPVHTRWISLVAPSNNGVIYNGTTLVRPVVDPERAMYSRAHHFNTLAWFRNDSTHLLDRMQTLLLTQPASSETFMGNPQWQGGDDGLLSRAMQLEYVHTGDDRRHGVPMFDRHASPSELVVHSGKPPPATQADYPNGFERAVGTSGAEEANGTYDDDDDVGDRLGEVGDVAPKDVGTDRTDAAVGASARRHILPTYKTAYAQEPSKRQRRLVRRGPICLNFAGIDPTAVVAHPWVRHEFEVRNKVEL